MPKKKENPEDEIQLDEKQPAQKTSSFCTRWFAEHAVNNTSEMRMICDLTARSAQEQFSINVRSGHTEVYAVIFYATFMSILEFIKEKQKTYNEFSITIANSLNIGYTNNDDQDNEKVGNFMPIMEYIGTNRTYVDSESSIDDDKISSNCIHWKELNIKKNVEYYKEIQERAFDKLIKEFNVNLRTSEAIFPLFCIFLDHITSVIKIKYQDAEGTGISEISMNVLSLFDIYYSYNEDEDKEIYEYLPGITVKLCLKSDTVAGRNE